MGKIAGENHADASFEFLDQRRRIIRRPRLTELLNAAPSRVIALVAPAGFGKTTLAREWLASGERRGTWYRGTEASSDVAELISGLARSLDTYKPGVAIATMQRVKSANRAELHAKRLAEALLVELGEWPTGLWLVIDDYHHLMRSRPAEEVVRVLSESDANLLVTSRERPTWATPRRLLYGEVYELSRGALALTQEEAHEVVGSHTRTDLPGLMALTEGWPAVIGLAALARESPVRSSKPLPESLYEFFAEELFRAADAITQQGLCTLCLLPELTSVDIEALLGPDSGHVTERGAQLGFLNGDRESGLDMHRLLRTFLRQKLALSPRRAAKSRNSVASFLLKTERWDDAFALIVDYNLAEHLERLIELGLDRLLDAGRIATMERWIEKALSLNMKSPAVDLMQAEVLFREGNWPEAERFSLSAANKFDAASPLKARAFRRAGNSAQLSDNHDRALKYHQDAWRSSSSQHDACEALWGMFITQCELEQVEAAQGTLEEFKRSAGRPEDELRVLSSAIILARRLGGLAEAVPSPRSVRHMISRPAEPEAKSGFLQTLSTGLNLVARYEDALEVSNLEIREARANSLAFVMPHAYCNAAVAHLGLRNTKNAAALIRAAANAAIETSDMHATLNARAIHARLLLAQGKPTEALSVIPLTAWSHRPTRGMGGDYLATRALALACSDRHQEARRCAQEARDMSRDAEARVMAALALAITALKEQGESEPPDDAAQEKIRVALKEMESTGNRDSVVCAYRAHPPLLRAFVEIDEHLPILQGLIAGVGDDAFARRYGVETEKARETALTPREWEVVELLRAGMTNHEIAKTLWITESTVKVHVRHIKRKLNARTRTEVALRVVAAD
jgi:ATP/maltotriose-dependent transcriptional regulator MalT